MGYQYTYFTNYSNRTYTSTTASTTASTTTSTSASTTITNNNPFSNHTWFPIWIFLWNLQPFHNKSLLFSFPDILLPHSIFSSHNLFLFAKRRFRNHFVLFFQDANSPYCSIFFTNPQFFSNRRFPQIIRNTLTFFCFVHVHDLFLFFFRNVHAVYLSTFVCTFPHLAHNIICQQTSSKSSRDATQ